MVVDGAQVEAVLAGRDGLLDTMRAGTVMVCSTIALAELRAIAERAASRGVTLIDCPVSGGVTGAEAGTLTLLCGGDAAAFEAQRPLPAAMGSQVVHMGPLGAGLVSKLANTALKLAELKHAEELAKLEQQLAQRGGVARRRQ